MGGRIRCWKFNGRSAMFTGMPSLSTASMILCAAGVLVLVLVWSGPGWAQADCRLSNRGTEQMQSARITLLNDQRRLIEVDSLIADDSLERASGYQYICPQVIARTTILFRYTEPGAGRFHMHNVKAPLDIGFFDENGVLIQAMVMHPYTNGEEILYAPMRKYQYALEARRGFFKEKELSAGSSELLIETLP